MKLHIAIAAPIATADVIDLLNGDFSDLPKGYTGAPFTGVLIAELIKAGHKVSAFTTDTSIYNNKTKVIKASGERFDFYICPERPRAWRPNGLRPGRALDFFSYERKLISEAIKAVNPDIIHAHWTYEFALAAIKTGHPHLITCHDSPSAVLKFNPYPYRAMRYIMARLCFNKGKNFSTVSDYMLSQIQHYTKNPIRVIANPLANYVTNTGYCRLKPKTKKIALICNGWDNRKNPKPSLLAFSKLIETYPDSELHLYGNEFGENQLAHQWCLAQQIAKNMFFHGATPHKQLILELNNLDLLLHPSLEESFGVVIAEAMALGLAIVAGRHSGAIPDVVGAIEQPNQQCCAVLTDISDPLTIVNAIIEAFNDDYAIRSELAYHRARRLFSVDIVHNAYLKVYSEFF